MLPRILSCVLCACLVAPTLGEIITVENGDSFDRIDVLLGDELVMNGGRVEFLNNQGGSVAINGGTLGEAVVEEVRDTERHAAHVTITGYEQQFDGQLFTPGPMIDTHGLTHAEIHGYNFRVFVNPRSSERLDVVGFGWLLDGSLVHFELSFDRVTTFRDLQTMTLVTHEREFSDPSGDWGFDLEDLNIVRNNFGSSGPGDTNFDGVVDLVDLNTVRNKFGVKYPDSFPMEWEYTGEVPLNSRFAWNPTMPIPVPEPSTMALTLFALSGIPSLRRCRSFLAPSP